MRRLFRVSVLAMGLVGLLAAPALADPPGNNGTVKIDGLDLDEHPNNEPHPGCLFEVDFYGFGPDLDATSTFYAWPPTGSMQQVHQVVTTLDSDDSEGGGSEAGWDGGTGLIDLSEHLAGIIPHPQQGFHVKLQVDVPEGSDSNAYSKYKVFWVTCEYSPSPEASALAGGQVPVEFTGGSISPLLIVALIALVGFVGARVTFGRIARRS